MFGISCFWKAPNEQDELPFYIRLWEKTHKGKHNEWQGETVVETYNTLLDLHDTQMREKGDDKGSAAGCSSFPQPHEIHGYSNIINTHHPQLPDFSFDNPVAGINIHLLQHLSAEQAPSLVPNNFIPPSSCINPVDLEYSHNLMKLTSSNICYGSGGAADTFLSEKMAARNWSISLEQFCNGKLRPDQRCLEIGEFDMANSEKSRLEQRQYHTSDILVVSLIGEQKNQRSPLHSLDHPAIKLTIT
ncbi:Oxysterol-binding protein-related protein 1C [Platanthera zijinensis]|uniref:Oxysterol-binding protein-related protein 1C n=1 Tax=Platanthera zijinensis TaxID=2320716 RepID=A0AAP0C029_9ASPA